MSKVLVGAAAAALALVLWLAAWGTGYAEPVRVVLQVTLSPVEAATPEDACEIAVRQAMMKLPHARRAICGEAQWMAPPEGEARHGE